MPLAPEARDAYFVRHRIPAGLRLEVESLLQHDGPTESQLIRRIAADAEVRFRQQEGDGSFGPFRLQRLLGSGGMGDVYLAERIDGEVQQTVAIKFLRGGAYAELRKDRFLRERQILASLRHAGIAHFIDAGHGPGGQPFFVMEYVEGIPIDAYCAQLPLRHKLELFLQVCEAVSYAHRNLVVHRDLKPSNILVDASGRARLLDFGIARILDETTGQTRTQERMLTPDYASPEQVRGQAQSTSTDVYSLGAVLYKLLTGDPPHVRQPGSEESMDWVICHRDPAPATRLNPALPKDLDFILRMALRKEPEARYASVERLMEDVRAFLEFHPVRARSQDSWYRARRFARRYWIPVTATFVAIAGLAAGLIVAQQQRAVAERRFNDVRHLSNKLLDIDVFVRQLPGASATRQLIVNTALDYLGRLSKDAAGDPGLALELATAYMRVGRVQGVPIAINLGQPANAEQNLQIAEGLIQSVLTARPSHAIATLRAAQIAHDRMILAQERRPNSAALPLARQSARWLEQFLHATNMRRIGPQDSEAALIVGMNVANWFAHENLHQEATSLLRRTIDLAVATNNTRQAGAARIVLARTQRAAGDLDGALATIREGVAMLQPPAGEVSIGPLGTFGLALITQGEILGEDEAVSLGRGAEAIPFFERGYRIAFKQAHADTKDALSRLSSAGRGLRYAAVLRHTDPLAALRVCDEVLQLSAQVPDNPRARRGEVRTLSLAARILLRLQRTGDALHRIEQAFSRLRDLKLYPSASAELDSEPADALRASADYRAAIGDLPGAIAIHNEILRMGAASLPTPESDLYTAFRLSALYASLASLHRRIGQPGEAAAFTARRIELWRKWDHKLPGNPFVGLQTAEATRAAF